MDMRLPWWPKNWSVSSLHHGVAELLQGIRALPPSLRAALQERSCISTVFVSCQLEQTLPPTLTEGDVSHHLRALYRRCCCFSDVDDDDVETILLSPPSASWVGDDAKEESRNSHLAQLEQHLKALIYLCLYCKDKPLTSHVLKQAHYILMRGATEMDGTTPAGGGRYRDHGVGLGTGLVFLDPGLIESSVEDTLAKFRDYHQDQGYARRCASLFFEMIMIHPFSDGNGRLCRLLVNFCLMTHGFPFPLPIAGAASRTRKHFFEVLQHAQKSCRGDTARLSAYILECVYHRLESLSGQAIECL